MVSYGLYTIPYRKSLSSKNEKSIGHNPGGSPQNSFLQTVQPPQQPCYHTLVYGTIGPGDTYGEGSMVNKSEAIVEKHAGMRGYISLKAYRNWAHKPQVAGSMAHRFDLKELSKATNYRFVRIQT